MSCVYVSQANRALTSAPWIRSVASRYVREYIGTEPFLAVHVRPYPVSTHTHTAL